VQGAKERDYIIAGAGPPILFRTDSLILDFKKLGIMEISTSIQLLEKLECLFHPHWTSSWYKYYDY
jgi:hypothetical protein